jgi:epoxyqueuosine reductase
LREVAVERGVPTKSTLARIARRGGAPLLGVAAVTADVPGGFRRFARAVVCAMPLSRGVLATCGREPTRVYAYHYRAVNAALDNIACRLAAHLESSGFETFAVPASQITSWDGLTGAVSHVRLAVRAGLGFLGRNNLLVTPAFGAGVRLASVFTDAPLAADGPAAGDCGECRACAAACPAAAIGEDAASWAREECVAALRRFKKHITNQYICGVCVRACPGRARPAE